MSVRSLLSRAVPKASKEAAAKAAPAKAAAASTTQTRSLATTVNAPLGFWDAVKVSSEASDPR